MSNYSVILWREHFKSLLDADVCIDQPLNWIFILQAHRNGNLHKCQHVAPLRHIMLTLNQPVVAMCLAENQ